MRNEYTYKPPTTFWRDGRNDISLAVSEINWYYLPSHKKVTFLYCENKIFSVYTKDMFCFLYINRSWHQPSIITVYTRSYDISALVGFIVLARASRLVLLVLWNDSFNGQSTHPKSVSNNHIYTHLSNLTDLRHVRNVMFWWIASLEISLCNVGITQAFFIFRDCATNQWYVHISVTL